MTNKGQAFLARSLAALQAGRDDDALYLLGIATESESVMGKGLLDAIAQDRDANAYDQPRAFEVFIRGGGNVALYEAVSANLARSYELHRPRTLLDIGAGDGMALLPALASAAFAPPTIDVVEPNATLAQRLASASEVTKVHQATLESFVGDLPRPAHWDMAQSTFALQSIEPAARRASLRRLANHVDRLLIVDFDVPEFEPDSHALYESLAHRYESAAADYGDDALLVSGGFLAPMLLGQLRATTPSNFEQPAEAWAKELAEAGFTIAMLEHVHDYSWAPAFHLEAVVPGRP